MCERERTRWYELGEKSHLLFNPDLPLADQVVALATLTAAADQVCATSLLAALPNQAEVTRLGAEALAAWAHRLYAGPGYWNPLRPDLLAEQHLADTAQLPALATSAVRLAAGQRWEAGLLTQLLAELNRGAPNQPALLAALDELLAAALPRIVDLAVTADRAELADLASLALQLAPQPRPGRPARWPDARTQRAARRARRHPHRPASHPGPGRCPWREPDAANRLAWLTERPIGPAERSGAAGGGAGRERGSRLHPPGAGRGPPGRVPARPGHTRGATWPSALGDLGRAEEALAVSQEAVSICRELAAARPGRVHRPATWPTRR